MMETKLWTSFMHVQENVHLIFKLLMYYKHIDMFKSKKLLHIMDSFNVH